MSDNWRIIVLVVWKRRFSEIIYPHVAGYRYSRRIRLITKVLEWIDKCYGWAIIYIGDILSQIKTLTKRRYPKSRAWRIVLSEIFLRIQEELKNLGLDSLENIYADSEFSYHSRTIKSVFGANVYIGKYPELIPADIIAYATYIGKLVSHKKIKILKD